MTRDGLPKYAFLKFGSLALRCLAALSVVLGVVVSTSHPTSAADYRLEVVGGTFTTKVGDRLIFTVSNPSNAAVAASLIDPAATAVVQMSNPLLARSDIAPLVAGGAFNAEAESAIGGPIFRTITENNSNVFQVAIPTSSVARRDGSLRITRDGLRAIRLTLSAPTGVVSELTTFINVVSGRVSGQLPVTFIASLDGAPALQPDGSIVIGAAEREQLRNLRDLLYRKPPGVPVAVRIRPELLNGLSRSTDPDDQVLLGELTSRFPDNDVLVGTYRPTDVSSYATAGLKSAFEAQLLRAETVLDAVNGPSLTSRAVWYSTEALDVGAVNLLRDFGVTNVVMGGQAVNSFGSDINTSRPYAMRTSTSGVVLNLADVRYSRLIDEPIGTAYESATAIAAEIVAQRNEISSSAVGSAALGVRQIVLTSASGTPKEPLVAAVLLRHLRNTPQVQLRRVADLAPTLEGLASIAPPSVTILDIVSIQTRTSDAIGQVESVRDVVAQNDGLADRWIELIDVANDTTLTDTQRDAYLDVVLRQTEAVRNAVTLPTSSFTVGSRDSEIRLTLTNASDFTVSLQLRVTSPTGKITFAAATFPVVIAPLAQEEVLLRANARANGLIPIELVLTTPGGTVLDVASVRVRVNAIAGLGRGISAIFVVLLIVWWVVHTRRQYKKKDAEKHPALRSQP